MGKVLWTYDYDFSRSAAEFQRAIQLNPNYPTAHFWYGSNVLSSLGRFEDAIAEMKRALELDPLSVIINADLASVYFTARRYDEAIAQARRTIELDPGFYYPHRRLGEALDLKGDYAGAIAELQKARELNDDPSVLARLGHAYAAAGKTEEAQATLAALKEESKRRYVSKYGFALLELGLGNEEQALDWLEAGYQAHDGLAFIKVDPFLTRLHGDPRFEALVAKVFAPKNGSSP